MSSAASQALVALVNLALEPLTGLTLQTVMGWVLWPLAWAILKTCVAS